MHTDKIIKLISNDIQGTNTDTWESITLFQHQKKNGSMLGCNPQDQAYEIV